MNQEKLIELIKDYGFKEYWAGRFIGQRNYKELAKDSAEAFQKIERHLTPAAPDSENGVNKEFPACTVCGNLCNRDCQF